MATTEKGNKAAGQLSRTMSDSFKVGVDQAVALRERNTKFARSILDSGTREIRQQTEGNRAMVQEIVGRAQNQREAFQTVVEESIDAYMDFVFAPLSYYKQGLQFAESEITEGGFPIQNYDGLNVEEVGNEFDNLSAQELREVQKYEKANKNRDTVVSLIDRKLKPAS